MGANCDFSTYLTPKVMRVTRKQYSDPMAIERIELYELTLPLLEPFIISGGTMTVRRSLVVVIHDQEGHRGYGESPPFELPFYSEETLSSARYLIESVLIPRLVKA